MDEMDQIYSPDTLFRPETLIQLLRTRARHQPDHQAFLYLADGEQEEASLTFAEVDQRARSIAAWLQEQRVSGGQALLLYPPGLDFITAFFGCLYAGVVAVPVYPPRLNRPSPRIRAIVANAQVTVALTTAKIYRGLERRFDMMPKLATLRWLNSEEMPDNLAGHWQDPGVTGDSLAFLQYTSGSTGSPKGVMLSHGNLIHNLKAIYHGFQITNEPTGVFWLPSYHDMGLIGGILEPMYIGVRSVLMAPAAFLQRPLRWLQAISHYEAGVSGAPNFAYQMCVDKISPEQREGLDLSCWNIAFCGAEPIRLETLENFANTFAAHGFKRDTFYPCYGLAENTLIVSGGAGPSYLKANSFRASALSENKGVPTVAETDDGITLVSCGQSLLDQQITIVNPESSIACAAGEIGEIWTAGPSVAQGYWRQPELTEQIFHARLSGSKEGPFLRTGDLGFLYEGALYVTGRLKDLIIIRGRNHYPQDIEHTAEQCHEALEVGMSAAFSVTEGGEEKLVIVHEVTRRHRKPDMDSVVAAVRRALAQEHQLQVHAIVLIRPLSMPRTSSGKIMRHACKQAFLDGSLKVKGEWHAGHQAPVFDVQEEGGSRQTAAAITAWLVAHIATQLRIATDRIDTRAPFVDYGLDSVQAVSMAGELETWLGRSLSPTLIWDYPTIEGLASHLAGVENQQPVAGSQAAPAEQIALIGLGCRFPGADGPEEFWRLLHEGQDAIQEVPAGRWDLATYYGEGPEPIQGKMNTRWGGFLDQVDLFDAGFFGISPREAARLDPQQRLLLEVTWEALERAGQNPEQLAGSATGVFVGISSSDYSHLQFSRPDLIDAYAGTGNAHSLAANRLSYLLNLHGPSMAIDTACSSSLVATHLAMNSLRNGEADLALAGGVNVLLSPDLTITFSQARMMASDGRCKTFDARADGYVRAEGCGMVVLKRLSDAQRDGDPVLAVLRGSAVNQDGRSNGLTAPNGLAQQAVIRQALARAGVKAADISYVEAHGTGTSLGDPIEIHSLQAVLDDGSVEKPAVVGSVKTNIGHLEAAAGAAGLIKTVLALIHKEIPPHLHFRELNPHITLDGSRLRIGSKQHTWLRGDKARLAGVSSFGFGGTNAHIIVQEAPLISLSGQPSDTLHQPVNLFTLSAKDERALHQLSARHASHLADNPLLSLDDVCYTANSGRAQFTQRLALVAESTEQLQQELSTIRPPTTRRSPLKIAFLFTGQGAQYEGMGQQLYESQPVFRAALDRCAAVLDQELELPLLTVLYPENNKGVAKQDLDDSGTQRINETTYTQPALFAIEYALAELWRSWGVEADMVMGHSVGEYVAACIAGVMSLEDGLKLIAARGRLMGALPSGGAMVAIFASEAWVQTAITPYKGQVSIAAVNGPNNVVISGMKTSVMTVVEKLKGEGVESRALTVSHAFHSPLMEPILESFAEIAGQCNFHAPLVPLVSNLTGQLLSEAPTASYWRSHVRQAVRFADGMQTLAESGATVFLEIGPQPHLVGMGKRCLRGIQRGHGDSDGAGAAGQKNSPPAARQQLWLSSLRKKQNDWKVMLGSAGELYTSGLNIDWAGFYGAGMRQKVVLPTYPFQRERHWLDVAATPAFSLTGGRDVAERTLHDQGPESGTVRRLPTAVPLFEATLDLSNSDENEEILRKNALAVARLFWGEGTYEVISLATSTQIAKMGGQLLTQTTLNITADGIAFFQTFGSEQQQVSWQLLASGEVRRGKEEPSRKTTNGDEQARPLTRQAVLDAEPQTRLILAQQYLQEQVCDVLGLDRARLRAEQPLDTLGMDSLMALELKNRLESDLQVDLPVVSLLQGPTITELSSQLLDFLDERPAVTLIQPVTRPGEAAPLSYDQQAMWVLHQLLPPDVSFNVAGAARIRGEIDIPALRRALQKLVSRHASLRTTFTVEQGQPAQIVQELGTRQTDNESPNYRSPILVEIEAVGWDEDTVRCFLEKEAHRPFNLEQGPLLRLVILKRTAQESTLLLSLNHLITDFWSMALLVQELYLLYTAELTGSEAALPTIDLIAADYARWQAEMLDGPEGEALRQYWLKQLAGDLPHLDLPKDRPRPVVLTFKGDSASRQLSPTLTTRIKALSKEHGTTLATTLLAAFQTLLHRYTGQEDLLVGTVFAGRERVELQKLSGYFVNPVALRADFSGDPTFAEFLARTRRTMLEAVAHQEYPLPRLAEELAAANKQHLDPSRPPLFETMFIMQRAQVMADKGLSAFALGVPGARLELDGLTIESMPLGGQPAQFDLTLMMAEVDDGLAATLHYNTQLFDGSTVERLLLHLESMLEGIAAAGGQRPIATIPLLRDGEREQLLFSWNDTRIEFPREKTIHQLVSEQAQRTPGKVAVTFEGKQLTYTELEQRSNELALTLQQLGVGPETLVGLYVERSLEMVTGLLGVLKAGGAYIPLDPDFPAERIALVLEDAQPAVLVTQAGMLSNIEPFMGATVYLDSDRPAFVGACPNDVASAQNLAYVIYTSGSTGKPKGVQIAHEAAVNFLESMRREPGLSAEDHLLAVTTLSFDIALLELFLPLISGAQVTIASRETAMDGARLQQLIASADITVMQATPATWRLLLEAGWTGNDDLKVLCGGEALPADLAQQLLPRCASLWNMYGPTETTVWSTICQIEKGTEPISIGRPIANTQIYILDKEQQPVPIGVVGDLYIGGDGLARGYLNQPQLTAEKFVPNPFARGATDEVTTSPLLMYRTGDLARYLPDGNIVFLGRDDFQVKIRGYRIELGDIETAVAKHPAVAQNVCVAREGAAGDRWLVAYMVAKADRQIPAIADLRQFLRKIVPDYMVPSHFVTLEALPLMPNGKINRHALPEPAERSFSAESAYVPPRFELESQVAELCAAVLNLERISIHDSFFDLGGNSLLATRLIFQAREQFQVAIPLRQLFMQPTVAGLSQAIDLAQGNGHSPSRNGHTYDHQSLLGTMTLAELQAEASLDPDIIPGELPLARIAEPDHVLLTGATGFVGAFLLRDLLQDSTATIHCLVRAEDAELGLERVKQNMAIYGLWDERLVERVVPVPGDLGHPQFGLTEARFQELAHKIDVIIHNGALVNFIYSYHEHKATNVLGTQEVLRLAVKEKLKAVHFVSTLSVFHTGKHDDGTVHREDANLDEIGVPFGGYAKSKWVGEKLVSLAGARGIPAAIYRPGLVSGDSRSGSWNTADMMSTMAMACMALGAVPDLEVDVDIVPVDYVSKAVVTLVLGEGGSRTAPTVFNLSNPHTMPYRDLLVWANASGLPIRALPFEQWRRLLFDMAQQFGNDSWNPYLPLLDEITAEQVFMPTFDCHNTLQGLSGSSVTCPPVGPELLQTYLGFLQSVRLLDQ
jgi:amino acid adenylation domain-containing protein/thioester reductase-like protein